MMVNFNFLMYNDILSPCNEIFVYTIDIDWYFFSLLLIYGKKKSRKSLPTETFPLTPGSRMGLRQTSANQS